ncbi:MAG: GNAT family N-acetyltransferase [Gemmatimonadaceae bacterium]|nr:GNAT family N-acetyltransferase [Gemmatimonadaceae bacterium]
MSGADDEKEIEMEKSHTNDTQRSMLRPAAPADTPALIALAVATKLILPNEVDPLQAMLHDLHIGRSGADHRVVVWADDPTGPPVGVVYFCPTAMTDRSWDLLWIAVAPHRQGQGIGGELVRFTEEQVRSRGGRLLLIETSSLPRFDETHAFYCKKGYAEVAPIPDFYADGENKVIYAKRITERAKVEG